MCIKGNRIKLVFATKKDKKLIYEMLTGEEVIDYMFNDQHPVPTWDEFNEDEPEIFFSGKPTKEGSYLLIYYNGEVIGSISYSNEFRKQVHSELDIWIGTNKYLGIGLGREAINLLIDYLNKEYLIDVFLIRPWIENINAIKAYKKCGFQVIDNFNPEFFYVGDDLKEYGDGDYGKDETINLIKRI
ncbi:MAG: GNAT family N-acetyltransferase [Firmicutes bacterium]|nr:GNAT family N-acetyltransferase [Bacillota bacterium]